VARRHLARERISHSWDSQDHRAWVLSLATRLRADGIDAVIDQTYLALGARNPEFMERSVRESAHVLVICTNVYKRRLDKREGGCRSARRFQRPA
jgi:predicted metal-dependent phosphotriesterase family hydrolase